MRFFTGFQCHVYVNNFANLVPVGLDSFDFILIFLFKTGWYRIFYAYLYLQALNVRAKVEVLIEYIALRWCKIFSCIFPLGYWKFQSILWYLRFLICFKCIYFGSWWLSIPEGWPWVFAESGHYTLVIIYVYSIINGLLVDMCTWDSFLIACSRGITFSWWANCSLKHLHLIHTRCFSLLD